MMSQKTQVGIVGEQFTLNGRLTYEGVTWQGVRIEGLLMNARLVQAIFDDRNPQTASRWAFPNTGVWDAERNTQEFIAAMPTWRAHGLLAMTLNLQGGSPQGYSQTQPWHNSAINDDGTLDAAYLHRLARVLDEADRLGMVVILGIFYFGQAMRVRDDAAVLQAVDQLLDWLFAHEYRNILIEINNECDIHYTHTMLQPDGVGTLIQRVQADVRGGYRYPVSVSFSGGVLPNEGVLKTADFVLLHGNSVHNPARITDMVNSVRARLRENGRAIPILFNEDDHFDFERPLNNCVAAVRAYASWGYFDYRMAGEGYADGFQSVPVDWGLNSARKRHFFELLKTMTQA
jgi:hypothetical protein